MNLQSIQALHPHYEEENHLLILNLHHGKANEIGTEQLAAFAALCDLLEGPHSIVCVCTTSRRQTERGKAIFIAGANVSERENWSNERIQKHVIYQREIMRRLRHVPIFTTALVHGMALGWGMEFLLTADYVLSTATGRFGLPETGLGIIPGARGTAELVQVVGLAQALRLGCTGELIHAEQAHELGLVQEIVKDLDTGLDRIRALAQLLGTRSPTAIAAYKNSVLNALGRPESVRLQIEQKAYERCLISGDAAIGRQYFSEIRAGVIPPWPPRYLL